MRTKITLTILALATAASAQDYSKMSRHLVELTRANISSNAKGSNAGAKSFTGNNERTIIFVKGEEAAVEDYCISHRGDIHIVNIPVSHLAALSEDSRVQRMEANYSTPEAHLDRTAALIGADKVWQGTAPLPQAYDGAGVVVGNLDTAHDYTHPTFRSTADGRQRIVMVYDPLDIPTGQVADDKSPFPIGTLYTDTASIIAKQHSADYNTELHGTHTASTASGSGWGSPYRGIAPESDIYMATAILSNNISLLPAEYANYDNTAFMALQMQNILNYAESQGKPCVVNYSAGYPHIVTIDETLLNEYLDRISGPGKIIVASAGNSGADLLNHIVKTTDDNTVGGVLTCDTGTSSACFYIKTKDKNTLRIRNYTMPEDISQIMEIPLDFVINGNDTTSASGLKWNDIISFKNSNILNNMEIEVFAAKCVSDDDYIEYRILLGEGSKALSDNEYTVEIIGENTEADIYAEDGELLPIDQNGITLAGAKPGPSLAVPGALPSVITVGATAWNTTFTNTEGKTFSSNHYGSNGERTKFSSVGPTIHGIMKPDVMAPGLYISAADNSFYEEEQEHRKTYRTATTTFAGKEYNYLVESGTSMSAPIVTGTIALWLQADPTLTRERVMEIIAKTSTHYDPALPYPNGHYGYGEIDAYKGLLEILNLTAIEGLSTTHLSQATVRPTADGTAISVTLNSAATAPVTCRLYTTAGTLIKSVTLPPHSTSYRIETDGHRGVIAVQVGNMGSTLVRVR